MAGTSAAGWRWDPSLYEGRAAYYTRGRVPYPPKLIALIIDELDLDGHGRLLDVGCGPGSLTVPLATHVEQAVGVDPDEQMLVEASHQATAAGVTNVEWVHRRGEDLSLDLGRFQVVTMAQSFHWMDRGQVAGLLHQLLLVTVRSCTCTRPPTKEWTAPRGCPTRGRPARRSTL